MKLPQLLVRSNFSFLSSSISINNIINFAVDNKHKYCVITDYKTVNSFVTFYFEAKKNNLIPVVSLQFFWERAELLLIAKNLKGYRNLLKISNYQKIQEEWLDGLIVIHLDGEVIFETYEDFYIANSDCEKGVYIRENKFNDATEYEFFSLLCAIKNQTLFQDELLMNEHSKNDFLNQLEEREKNPTFLKNLKKILNLCEEYEICAPENSLEFDNSQNKITDLKTITFNNLKAYQEKSDIDKSVYLKRLEFELGVIEENKLIDYFLIVHDYVQFSKKSGILIGVGRGSVCGSLLAFLLNITAIDPIKHQLYFERFLNPGRKEKPDIDIDVDSKKRNELLTYLVNKYGKEHVAFPSVIQVFKFKHAFQECVKAFNLNLQEAIDNNKSLYEKLSKDFDATFNSDSLNPLFVNGEIRKVLELTKKLINVPKSFTIHPSGVVISSDEIGKYLSVDIENNQVLSRFSFEDIQKIQLIKFDILSLNYLEFLSHLIQKTQTNLDINHLNWNDTETYEVFASKSTSGIFQLEGKQMTELLSLFKPKNILELAIAISLLRPGAQKQIPLFLDIRNSQKKPVVIHPIIQDIVKNTNGIILFQEQIMEIVSKITSSTFSEADTVRKAISKKNKQLLAKLKNDFLKKGSSNQIDPESLEKLWNYIYEFAEYGFNKSHAIAYAHIAFQTAWFKTKFYEEFFVSLFEVFGIQLEYLRELLKEGYQISLPNIQFFSTQYCFKGKALFFPIPKIPQLSENFWLNLETALKNYEFSSLVECLKHLLNHKISKSEILLLNEIQFFNCLFQEKENQLFIAENIDVIYNSVLMGSEINASLLSWSEMSSSDKDRYQQKIEKTFEFLPIEDKIPKDLYVKFQAHYLRDIDSQRNSYQQYLGFIESVKESITRKNSKMYWITVYGCNYSKITLPYFSDLFTEFDSDKDWGTVYLITVTQQSNGNKKISKIVNLQRNSVK